MELTYKSKCEICKRMIKGLNPKILKCLMERHVARWHSKENTVVELSAKELREA